MTIQPQFERNLGFFTEEEQQYKLGRATVAIAGAGGDGGMLAIQLARLGVGAQGGEIRLADPDPFETENINRQAACTTATVGMNKADAVGDYITAINPDIRVVKYTEGIQPDNIESFVQGADLLIDETEFTLAHIGVGLAREARVQGVPNMHVLNVGFGAQVTSYHPQSRHTLERRLGIPASMPLDEVKNQEVSVVRWLAGLPSKYAHMDTFKATASGDKSAPSVAPGVAMAASMGSTQAVLHLLRGQNRRIEPVWAPKTLVMDAMTGESRVVRNPLLRTQITAASMALRSMMGRNPRASY